MELVVGVTFRIFRCTPGAILSLLGQNVLFSFRDELNSLRCKLSKTIEVFTQQVEIAGTIANRIVVAGEIEKDLVGGDRGKQRALPVVV